MFGIALNEILIPHVRPLVEQEVIKEYNTLKTSHSIDSQSATGRLEKWNKSLKYENINGNESLPRLRGGKYDYSKFNCQVLTHTDFAKLYLESYMIHFNAFDDHLDASAVLLLLGRVPAFPGTVQAAANSVRNERNDWAHCVFSKWNEAKFQHSFAEMEDLVKAMALPSSHEGKIVGELKDWQNKGDYFMHDGVCLVRRKLIICYGKPLVCCFWLRLWDLCILAELIKHLIIFHFLVTSINKRG